MAGRIISQLRAAPNQLTLLRLAFIPLIAIVILERRWRWALALFVIAGASDALDGLAARAFGQQTLLGQYLDPIADKLLLSTLFLELSAVGKVPWHVTVLVFSRDLFLLVVSAVLYVATSYRDFRPSILGKLSTLAQVATLFVVLLRELSSTPWIQALKTAGLWATVVLTVLSGLHYAGRGGAKIRSAERPSAAGR